MIICLLCMLGWCCMFCGFSLLVVTYVQPLTSIDIDGLIDEAHGYEKVQVKDVMALPHFDPVQGLK